MLVPICEECFKKFVKEMIVKMPPKQKSGMPVKEYYKLFLVYASSLCVLIDSTSAREQFVAGLSEENKKEVRSFGSIHNQSISDMVCYLATLEDFRKVIFGNIDGLVPDVKPMDVEPMDV